MLELEGGAVATMRMRVVVSISGVLLVVGSFLTWVTVDVGYAQFSTVGMDTIDGKLTAIAGVVVVLAAFALAMDEQTMVLGGLSGIAAAFSAAIVLTDEYVGVLRQIAGAESGVGTATLAIGAWITAAGALLGLGALVWMFVAERRRVYVSPVTV